MNPRSLLTVALAEDRIARTRGAALLVLRVMVIVQIIWTVYFCVRKHPAFRSIYYPAIFTPFAAAVALTSGRVRLSVDALFVPRAMRAA